MPIQVLMPALSPTMEKGNLAKWLKKEGDTIKSGDVIAEIETDKATMEVEATDEGTLGKILVPEGTADVAVNTPIATILADGESAADLGKAPAAPAPAPKADTAPAAAPAPAAIYACRPARSTASPSNHCLKPCRIGRSAGLNPTCCAHVLKHANCACSATSKTRRRLAS